MRDIRELRYWQSLPLTVSLQHIEAEKAQIRLF